MITLHVSPNGTDYGNPAFWDDVASKLSTDDVVVVFRAGEYNDAVPVSGTSDRVGDSAHFLTLTAERPDASVFKIAKDASDQSNVSCLDRAAVLPRFALHNAQNVILSGMVFTGPGTIDYIVRVRGTSNNVSISRCTFQDLAGVQYGATGTADPSTKNVVLERCQFRNVGCDTHAHMMYNAHGSHHLTLRDCLFEECAGDYVRFRDRVDYCVVERCTFIHRGDIYDTPHPFIAVPLFNDCKPGSDACPNPIEHPAYEYFGTHFTIKDNVFEIRRRGERAFVIGFLHQGWDPPRRFHLLTQAEGDVLENGTPSQRRMILQQSLGIDMSKVKFYGNDSVGERYRAALESFAAYGATSARWEAFGRWEAKGGTAVDIGELLNPDKATDASWFEAVIAALS